MECFVVDITSEDEDCAPGRAGRLPVDWVDELLDREVGRRMEESDDVWVLDGFSFPVVKRRWTNPEPLSLRKCENDDDDECLVLEVDPDKPVVVADEKVSGGFEEDDLFIVAEKGQVSIFSDLFSSSLFVLATCKSIRVSASCLFVHVMTRNIDEWEYRP